MARCVVAVFVFAAVATASAAAGPEQTPRRGGTVVVGPVQEPTCLNPLLVSCEGVTAFWVLEKVLAKSFVVTPALSQERELLSQATVTKTAPFAVTYVIRPSARWSDGVPVTARDFIFTHRAILEHLPAHIEYVHQRVVSVRAVGQRRVRVVLRSRTAEWRQLFEIVLPQHALKGQSLGKIWADRIDNPTTGAPIGSGPFLVERWERGKQLTLVRNSRYWGPHVSYLDRVVLRFCRGCAAPPPAEVLEALRGGDVDLALSRDTAIASELRRIPNTRVIATPTTGWEHLALRVGPGGHPALRNKLVRRALAYGIDRVTIARRLFAEIDPSYPPSDSAVFLNTGRSYRPNWKAYRYRPAVARRLLEQAGCTRGADSIYVCAGARLSLDLWTIAGSPLRERGVQLIQQQLRQAGIEAQLKFAPGPTMFTQVLPSGAFDAVSFSWFVSVDTIGGKNVFGCGGPQNFMGYCQRLVTRDFDEGERILDAEQRGLEINRADRQLAKDVPVIPLYQIPFVVASKSTLRGVRAAPFNLLWNAENWWLER